MHRVAVGQTQTATAAHARTNATVTCVKNGWQLVLVDHLVNGPSHFVVGVIALNRGVKLEAFDALFFDQAFGFARAHLALVRIYAAKGNHHVTVVASSFGNFFVWNSATA